MSDWRGPLLPPFSYYGGKTTLGPRIAAMLPEHRHYVEPFAGSLAVLLAKVPSKMETVNDLDGHLMCFWRVLRDRPDELCAAAAMTPHSRAEHQAAYDLDDCDDLERARRVWVLLSQGRGGTMRSTGWRFYADPSGSGTPMPAYLAGYVARMPADAWRLRQVSLECRDALDVCADYGQHRDVCIYADPPYLRAARNSSGYTHEMGSADEHRALADVLRSCKASVVLSGYDDPLYDDLYDGWHRTEIPTATAQSGTYDRRVEVLWSNRPVRAPDLFSDHAAPA